MPYGYGVSVNLLQLTQAYSIFANEGLIVHPRIYMNQDAVFGEKVLSPNVSNEMKTYMRAVVEEDGGTGYRARIPGYSVAGKTGTARKVVNGEYTREYVASFIGMAPSTNPKFIMAVMIDNPKKDSYYGGTVAGPVFKEVMKEALKLYDVPYDKQLNENLLDTKMDATYEDSRL